MCTLSISMYINRGLMPKNQFLIFVPKLSSCLGQPNLRQWPSSPAAVQVNNLGIVLGSCVSPQYISKSCLFCVQNIFRIAISTILDQATNISLN